MNECSTHKSCDYIVVLNSVKQFILFLINVVAFYFPFCKYVCRYRKPQLITMIVWKYILLFEVYISIFHIFCYLLLYHIFLFLFLCCYKLSNLIFVYYLLISIFLFLKICFMTYKYIITFYANEKYRINVCFLNLLVFVQCITGSRF